MKDVSVIRALYKLHETRESDQANKTLNDAPKPVTKPSKALPRKFKQDLAVKLKQVRKSASNFT
ncbi:hypothetical protein PsorP6_008622 [Peronosclerospora sorghi]|uniref:Uncharacterized protein n=1 Tax=Peronosclerospora sorghi TaxID=230839 RepID=A0ACC0WBI9_9STRA|nr:hypothetical protein PsorP6_008622 [Peronosclerospora sorghi]